VLPWPLSPDINCHASRRDFELSENNRKIDLIVTDLGGTLVKTDDAIMTAVKRAAKELGIPDGNADPVYDVFGTSIWEYVLAYLPEGHKDRTDECHERFWKLFPYEVLDRISPFDGVEGALRDLKSWGVRLAVLSGLRLESIESILSALTFKDWDAVRSSMLYQTEAGNSRALGIVALVDEFGVDPKRTIYIGDTDHDVRQAKRAGVISAVVKTGGQAVKSDDVCRRFSLTRTAACQFVNWCL
jgi:phosphoglycolate phosphatase